MRFQAQKRHPGLRDESGAFIRESASSVKGNKSGYKRRLRCVRLPVARRKCAKGAFLRSSIGRPRIRVPVGFLAAAISRGRGCSRLRPTSLRTDTNLHTTTAGSRAGIGHDAMVERRNRAATSSAGARFDDEGPRSIICASHRRLPYGYFVRARRGRESV